MNMFESTEYKDLVNNIVASAAKNGRGEYKRISEFLGVSSVLISQIFKGPKEISIEQGFKLCDYFGFIELEKKYFLTLVNQARAGTFELKQFYQKELEELQKQSKLIVNRVKHSKVLNEEEKGIFYSDWKYSAIRLSCELPNIKTKEDIQEKFLLTEEEVSNYLDFLFKTKLIKIKSGSLCLGTSSTHISKNSPFVKNHHRNWRIKAVESMDRLNEDEIMYTAPMSVSKEDFKNLNLNILKLIDEFVASASDTEAEELYFFNIDLRKM